jgi:23S rRNA G2445 N2-methylase RlmL
MAQAYPNSAIVGFDFHAQSVELARQRAAEAGVGDSGAFRSCQGKRISRHSVVYL